MKAISLLQPWASLVIMGAKTIETRSWQTAYRGELLIHASTGKKGSVLSTMPPISRYISNFNQLPFGAIIGSVMLNDVVPVELLHLSPQQLAKQTLEEKAFGDETKGRYAWLFSNPVQFCKTLPVRGTLGLWNYLPA